MQAENAGNGQFIIAEVTVNTCFFILYEGNNLFGNITARPYV